MAERVRDYALAMPGAWPDQPLRERPLGEAIADSYAMVVVKLPKRHQPEGWDQ